MCYFVVLISLLHKNKGIKNVKKKTFFSINLLTLLLGLAIKDATGNTNAVLVPNTVITECYRKHSLLYCKTVGVCTLRAMQ